MKYYAFITPESVGIFNDWNKVENHIVGIKNSYHKSFKDYEDAKSFIFSHLSEYDILDFCLDRCNLYLNKCFVRKAQFIAEKEANSTHM